MAARKVPGEEDILGSIENKNFRTVSDLDTEDILAYLQKQVSKSTITSPLILELNANAKKYVENQSAFKNLISKYEHSFEEEFMDTAYSKQSSEQRKFFEDSDRLIKNLETLYSVPGELDSYLRKIGSRIDNSSSYPLIARKYLESHRSNIGDVKEYFEKINDKMEQELDELVAEAIEKKVILDSLGKRADHSSPTKKNQPEG